MRTLRPMLVVAAAVLLSCGGSDGTTTDPTSNSNAGSGRTMSATYNNVEFKPTLLTSAYLNGQVSVNANDGARTLSINGLNVGNTGTYSFAAGNPNSLLGQWIDGNGSYSTVFTGSNGTITFTVLQLGRVAGSFNFTMRSLATGSTATIALTGNFDIKFP